MPYRTLVHSSRYEEQLRAIGNVRYLDAALTVVIELIARKAEAFKRVPNLLNFYIVETAGYVREDFEVPPLRILFSIDNEDYVTLRGIMEIPPEESDFPF